MNCSGTQNGLSGAGALLCMALLPGALLAQEMAPATPAEGYAVHVTAPHLYQGHETEPVHHYCKVQQPDPPIIVCLLYDSADPGEALHGVEYIVAKSLTRPKVSRGTWNSNFHDHAVEIATGRVKVLDMPEADAQEVADLVATTDGLILHLWPAGDEFPTGTVVIDQAISHVPLSEEEYARSVAEASRSDGGN